ncbi:MAG: dihydroneopterin triphosphate diphosphatase [Burkholderiales bacterium]
MVSPFKLPRSVLVVIHTPDLQVVLLERFGKPGFWQSVTGSQHAGESLEATARREANEETGLDTSRGVFLDWRLRNEYQIFSEWRWRYAPGVTRNTEHVFSWQVDGVRDIVISPKEHSGYLWASHQEAASRCFSWSNRDALLFLPKMLQVLAKGGKIPK